MTWEAHAGPGAGIAVDAELQACVCMSNLSDVLNWSKLQSAPTTSCRTFAVYIGSQVLDPCNHCTSRGGLIKKTMH